MAQVNKPVSNAIMQQLTADKTRTDSILAQHRARLKELEQLDPMTWGREISRARRAVARAETRLAELSRLFSTIK
jgi:hypothetical protein